MTISSISTTLCGNDVPEITITGGNLEEDED